MKKIMALVAVAAATVALATAEVTVGGRANLGLGLGTKLESGDLDLGKSLDFGVTGFAKVPVAEKISVQPELGFNIEKVGQKVGSAKGTSTVNVLDLAALCVYDIEVSDDLTVSPFAGPQFGYVIGKAKAGGDFSGETKVKPFLFDIVLGTEVAYKMGNGALVGDVRYNFGVTPLKNDDGDKMATLRSLTLGVGYQVKF
ncbi:MAG: PorT family protein [Treponema sp.]|nr:PorT family protein [Treponema sp.]